MSPIRPSPRRRRGPPAGWTGPRTTTRSRSSTRTGSRSCGSRSPTTRPGCAPWSSGCWPPTWPRSGSNAPTGRSSTPCAQAGLTVYVIPPGQLKNLRSRYGSAGNKDDRFDAYVLADVVRTDRRRLRPLLVDATGHHRAAPDRARPPRPGRPPGRGGQPAARPPADLLPRRGRAVRRHRLRHQPAVPRALPHPGPRRLALAQALGGLADLGGLQRPHPARDPAPAPHRRTAGATGPAADTAAAVTAAFVAVLRTLTTQIDALAARIAEQLDLHPDAPIFTSLPRSGSVRAARLLAEIGDARGRFPTADSLACLGRRRPLDPPVRQGRSRLLPLGRGQTTPRRPLRLRRRQPPRQPLGRRPLPPRPRPRPRPPPRRPRPGPRLGRHHLGLLDHQHPLRPRPNTAPSNASSTKINRRRLDTGQLIGAQSGDTPAIELSSPISAETTIMASRGRGVGTGHAIGRSLAWMGCGRISRPVR